MSHDHIEASLAKIRGIFEEAASRIDALKPGEKIPATTLATDIGKKHNMTCPQIYPTLKFLFDGYPGVDVRKGAHGGIIKLDPNAPAKTSDQNNSDPETNNNVTENDNG